MLAEESNGIVFCKFADIDIFQAVFGYIGEKMFQECTLSGLTRTSNRNDREIQGSLSNDILDRTGKI